MIRMRDIEAAVCARFPYLTVEDLRSKKRAKKFARPRQIAMYLAMELTDQGLVRIARHFDRDHSTVHHAVERIAQLQTSNPKIAAYVAACRERIGTNGNPIASAGQSGSMGQ